MATSVDEDRHDGGTIANGVPDGERTRACDSSWSTGLGKIPLLGGPAQREQRLTSGVARLHELQATGDVVGFTGPTRYGERIFRI
jgi:hypothetical protein